MGMFGPGKEGWLAEAEMLSWAFRHLKAEERDYLTKRLKHVLGKRTLKGSWFEKDKSLVEMLVAGPAHRAGLGSLPLMTAANTEKMTIRGCLRTRRPRPFSDAWRLLRHTRSRRRR